MYRGGETSDGNGIIVDKLWFVDDKNTWEGVKVLVQGCYCYKNRGPGIKIMATKNADVLDNTCYDNSQAKYPPSNLSKSATWAGEIVSQTANKNKFRRNIGVSTHAKKNYTNPTTGKSYAGAAGGFANAGYETLEKATNNSTGDNYSYTFPMTGNTIVDNLFFGYLKPGYSASTFKASIDTNIVSGAQGVDASTNLLGSKIGLQSPTRNELSDIMGL